SASPQNPVHPLQQLPFVLIIFAPLHARKNWTQRLLKSYDHAHRWFGFLFSDEIITTRFRAWQRFLRSMPGLFYPRPLSPPCSFKLGQALSISSNKTTIRPSCLRRS